MKKFSQLKKRAFDSINSEEFNAFVNECKEYARDYVKYLEKSNDEVEEPYLEITVSHFYGYICASLYARYKGWDYLSHIMESGDFVYNRFEREEYNGECLSKSHSSSYTHIRFSL